MTEPSLAAQTVSLAREIFQDNLAAAFVGGSYATGTNRPTSDIDTFVLLRKPQRSHEYIFARRFLQFHKQAGLNFDHCGEVFDTITLNHLLTFTERCIEAVPAVQRSACYLADCRLSIFRKGDVVFKFLADPKICVYDPNNWLSELEQRATDYFKRWPMPRVQNYKGLLRLLPSSHQAALADLWQSKEDGPDWTETPVGIGLERWFGQSLLLRAAMLNALSPVIDVLEDPRTCPLPTAIEPLATLLSAQCLAASSHTQMEETL